MAIEVVSGPNRVRSAPESNEGDPDYVTQKLRKAFSDAAGNLPDAPLRVLNLLSAQSEQSIPATMLRHYIGKLVGKEGDSLVAGPTGGENFFTDKLKALLGVDPNLKTDPSKRMTGAVAEGVGSALGSPVGGLLNFGKQLIISPAASLGSEIGAASTGESTAGRVAGGILGGVVAPSFGGISATLARIFKMANSPGANEKAGGIAESIINRQVKTALSGDPATPDNIAQGLALRQKIGPNFNPSVGEMADSPGMLEMQRRYALLNPQNLNKEAARTTANIKALHDYYDGTAPPALGGAGSVRSGVNQALSVETNALQADAKAVAGQLPTSDPKTLGARLTEIADKEKLAAKGVASADYSKAFAAAGETQIPLAPVIQKAEEILGQKLSEIKPESAPATVAAIRRLSKPEAPSIVDIQGNPIGPVQETASGTLREVDDIRKAINADIASAGRSLDPMAATRLRNLGQLHNEIDSIVGASGLPQQAKNLYQTALDNYRTNFVPRFKEGTNLRMFKDTSLNEPKILPDKLVGEYFKPDDAAGLTRAGQFGALFGGNAEAKSLATEGILDRYRSAVVNPTTGAIDPNRHAAFLSDYGRTLTAFKAGGVNALDEIGRVGSEALRTTAAAAKFNSVAKSLRYDTTDDMLSASLADTKVMANIKFRLDPEQRQTFTRLLMDKAWESGTASGMSNFIEKNQKALKVAIGDEHLNNLRDISKGLEMVERAPLRGNLSTGGPDVLKNATGVSMATVWAQYRAVSGGRQGLPTMAFNLAAPVFSKLSQERFSDIMERALHDPQTAASLRGLLLAQTPAQANFFGNVLEGAKNTAGAAWNNKSDIAHGLFGSRYYGNNAQRAAPAIIESAREGIQ